MFAIHLAGVPVPPAAVLKLAALVDDDNERETIIRSLIDPPAGLEELRGVLLSEHVARARGDMA